MKPSNAKELTPEELAQIYPNSTPGEVADIMRTAEHLDAIMGRAMLAQMLLHEIHQTAQPVEGADAVIIPGGLMRRINDFLKVKNPG